LRLIVSKKVERDNKATIRSLGEQLEQQHKLKGAEKDAAVKEAYFKFGEHNDTILAEYKKEIDLLKEQITTLQSKDVENNELKAKAAEDAAKIAKLNSQITELDCDVPLTTVQVEAENAALKQRVADLRETLARRHRFLDGDTLTHQMASVEANMVQLLSALSTRDASEIDQGLR
jgi:hypothetical protein